MTTSSTFIQMLRPWQRPHQFGAIIAAAIILKNATDDGWSLTAAWTLSAAWLSALVVGASWRSLKLKKRRTAGAWLTEPSWNGVLVGTFLACYLFAQTFSSVPTQEAIASYWAVSTAFVYAACKFGCIVRGCCGWGSSSEAVPSLQSTEFVLASIIFALTIYQSSIAEPRVVAATFLICHGAQRLFSKFARASQWQFLPYIDISIISALGAVLAFGWFNE